MPKQPRLGAVSPAARSATGPRKKDAPKRGLLRLQPMQIIVRSLRKRGGLKSQEMPVHWLLYLRVPKILQTVWKRLRLGSDTSPELVLAIFSRFCAGFRL